MIALDIPGVPSRLNVRRVRRVSPFVFLAMPIGWGLLAYAGALDGLLAVTGLVMLLAGFFASLLLIATGVQRIASGMPAGLDEMQMTARLRAQSEAYRWFSAWILIMAIALEVGPAFTGVSLVAVEPALTFFFLWVIAWSITLPAFFLARLLPTDNDLDEQT